MPSSIHVFMRCMVAALDERGLSMQRFPGLIQALCKPSGDHRPQNRSCQAGSRHFLIHLGPATGVVPAFTHPQAAGLTLRRQPLRVPGRHRVEGLARGPVTSAEQHLSMELNVKIDGKPSSFLLACLTMLLMLGVVFWQGRQAPEPLVEQPHTRTLRESEMIDPSFTPSIPSTPRTAEEQALQAAQAPQQPPVREPEPEAAQPPAASKARLPTIFVSIAGYRDPECSDTLHSLMLNASHPERVHAAVVQQIKLPHEACVTRETPNSGNIQVVTVPYFMAKGPTVARHTAASLFKNEDYFMQIDSHSKLVEGWDDRVIEMYKRCPSKKCALSHYPPSWDQEGNAVVLICKSHWDEGSKLPSFAPLAYDVKIGQFMPTPFTGAGFIFAPGESLLEVPFDPNLDMMFVGEEILHSARMWTHGYDIFSPDENLVWHHYNRKDNPNVYGDRPEDWWHVQQKSNARARYILNIDHELKPTDTDESEFSYSYYGMGQERTLQQYWDYAGIDPVSKNLTTEAKFCHPPQQV